MSAQGQRALARLFGLDPDPDAPPAEPTGLAWIGAVPFAASEQPPSEDDTPEFDGGVRDPAPGPENADKDHAELVKNLLTPRDPGGGTWLG